MTRDYEYLAELELNTTTGLYNLFLTTYNGDQVNLLAFICERRHNMRLDLVSNDIYNSTRYVGTLCQLNNILNPFSIREGDVLFYCNDIDAENLLKVPEVIRQSGVNELLSKVKSDLINALKKRKKDPNVKGIANRNDLPPSVLPSNAPQIVIDNNKIKIAPNMFKNPNVEPETVEPAPGPLSEIQPETVERVLVNRYIKKINQQ
jgi:hypothetical protein